MKKMTLLGLGLLSLALAIALRRISNAPPPVVEARPAAVESQQIFKAAHAHQAAHGCRSSPQTQPLHASLLAAVEAETDPDQRNAMLERVVESVPAAGLPALLDSLAHQVSPGAAELRQLLIRRWAETDAPAVAQWTSQLPESAIRRAALEHVAIAWANADLPAATSWVRGLPEGNSKQAATLGLAYEAARTAPVAALELAGPLAPTRARDDLFAHAVSQWATTDFAAAVQWVEAGVTDEDLRQRLLAAVAVAVAGQDGAAAATLAATALTPGEEQDRVAVAVVQRWVQNEPGQAAAWVAQFPDTPVREVTARNLVAFWAAQDLEAAGKWVRELPAGSLRAVGMTAYAQALADRDQAWAVANQIPLFDPRPN